jgi:glucose/arabinose dehydrogenase
MRRLFCLIIIPLVLIPFAVAAQDAPTAAEVTLVPVADGFARPVLLTHAPDESGRLFIMEQGGPVWILDADGQRLPDPFLDLTDRLTWDVNAGGYTERGMLGLAFHPDFAENGRFFVAYSDREGATVIARFTVADDPDRADPASEVVIFSQAQPYANHNGGHLAFGPDGYLYLSLGDGGSANDPLGAGQNLGTLLGTIVRLDVDGDGYTVPADNPFIDQAGAAPEIWAYGLRNPWRFSFDRETGDLYIADVGQNLWEEVNFQPAASAGGENYGWNGYEADSVFNQSAVAANAVAPVAAYDHSLGCSITGGYVYRGEAVPSLRGLYLYGDWCSGRIWYALRDEAGDWTSGELVQTGRSISSFGEDANGELYVVDYSGTILRFAPAANP